MTARTLLTVALVALLSGIAFASNLTGPEGGWTNKTLTGPTTRGGAYPATCSNSLNFSQACNSQYLL